MNASQRYLMNYSWVWAPENPELIKVARLVMSLELAPQEQDELEPLLEKWLDGLNRDFATNHWYSGGCGFQLLAREEDSVQILFSSGGQDVADSLQAGVDTFYDQVLKPLHTARVTWTELPLG
ncbi:hypothetical protein [Specibacter sp. NPDC078709]|uniref:hypothetical protein n=1 Tax=Specibacter sp. NPDC078709 TaxID=3154364 RepID=UPI0034358364